MLAHQLLLGLGLVTWHRLTGRRVLFTCLEPVDRASLADRRL
jgi:hypothetical protein